MYERVFNVGTLRRFSMALTGIVQERIAVYLPRLKQEYIYT